MRILMATGGSLHSETALWLGGQIAATCGAAPTALTVIGKEGERQAGEQILKRAQTILRQITPHLETKMRVGRPDVEILREAAAGGYDLLVIGDRQLHSFGTRMRGSVVAKIARQTPCSLLIAKGKIEPLQRILVCDSGNQQPSVVTSLVETGLVGLLGHARMITVLHVMSQMSAGTGADEDEDVFVAELMTTGAPEGTILHQDLALLAVQGIAATATVRRGLVVDEILTEAQMGDYDLVVVGVHRDEGWQRLLLDDITHKVAVEIDRPVLIVR